MARLLIVFLFTLSISAFAQVTTTTVYTATNGTKYHKINCKYLTKSKIETTVEKAVFFTPCKVCKPYNTDSEPTIECISIFCPANAYKGAYCKREDLAGSISC